MIAIRNSIAAQDLVPAINRLFELSAQKIRSIEASWNPRRGTPVFTVEGRYTTRGWTEWTRGFQYGAAILQFDATEDRSFLDIGIEGTLKHMASHVSHTGVHDHGFNIVSTFGNLLRLMREGRIQERRDVCAELCQMALKVSGAVQAARWTPLPDHLGFIHSFNGPHSLFIDTMRSLRSLALAHSLGHVLMGEQDEKISLLARLLQHAETTARYTVYWGEGRDRYDVRGRTSPESIFNIRNGSFRCPSTQQGYSPFSTWTRGLAWAILGFTEQLEYLAKLPEADLECDPGIFAANRQDWLKRFQDAACATADHYFECAAIDGIPFWDTGAPGLSAMPDWAQKPSDPYNNHEPVDSSAAAISAQGLLRLGRCLNQQGENKNGERYIQAGLTIAETLFQEPYLSTDPNHQGLILHSIYHRPNGWDRIPPEMRVPCGESSMWGDYHARELALLIFRMAKGQPHYDFFTSILSG